MSNTTALDRYGQEIHVGDRVKIIGVEVSNYLKAVCSDCIPESVLADVKDYFGVVVDEDFLQIVDETGDTIYDLTTNFSEPDPCLEIVSDMENHHEK